MTLASPQQAIESSRSESTLPLILLTFLFLLVLAWLPILTSKIPPLGDYINHLARMHVIAIGGGDPLLARYYEIDWHIIPNLAMDLIVPPLIGWFDIYTAGKLFILFYTALLLTGPHAIHYALFRRFSLGPLVGFLFLYNQINAYGNVNYLCGLGIALWGIACYIRLRRSPPALRMAVSLVFVLALFACHLFALGLYGLSVLCFELWADLNKAAPRRHIRRDLLVLIAPFAAVPILLAFSPTSGFVGDTDWQLAAKLQGLFFAVKTYDGPVDLAVAGVMAGAALLAWRHRILRLHPAALPLIAASVPLYLAMPVELMSSWGADLRLPIGIIFILIGFLDWRLPSRGAQTGFVAALAALVIIRFAVIEESWIGFDRITADFGRSLALIDPGRKILVVVTDHPTGNYSSYTPIVFLPMQAMIERSSFVSEAFTHPGQQPLRARPDYREIASELGDPEKVSTLVAAASSSPDTWAGPRQLAGWPRNFDYVYVLFTEDEPNPAPRILAPLYRGERFQLYRVVHGEN